MAGETAVPVTVKFHWAITCRAQFGMSEGMVEGVAAGGEPGAVAGISSEGVAPGWLATCSCVKRRPCAEARSWC